MTRQPVPATLHPTLTRRARFVLDATQPPYDRAVRAAWKAVAAEAGAASGRPLQQAAESL